MNIFDIIIAALLLFAFVRGLMKGLFAEVASLIAIIAGVYVAIHYAFHLEAYLVNNHPAIGKETKDPTGRPIKTVPNCASDKCK